MDDPINAIDPLGLMSLMRPENITRRVHNWINPMSSERIIKELAKKEIDEIRNQYGDDNASIKNLKQLIQFMDDEGLPSPAKAIKMTLEQKGLWPFLKENTEVEKEELGK